MSTKKVKSNTKVVKGKVAGKPKTVTTTKTLKNGKMIVEVKTIFKVDNPDEIFALNGPGISMSVETQN